MHKCGSVCVVHVAEDIIFVNVKGRPHVLANRSAHSLVHANTVIPDNDVIDSVIPDC